MVRLTPYTKGVIVGLLLSDGWLTIATKRSKNARLGFKQSLSRSAYVWFVFNILSHYCSSSQLTKSLRLGNKHYGLQFFTRSLPCFTDLHSLFYPNGTKIIPDNIYELLTPIALAHVIMGDGNALSHGLIICTNSFSAQDVVRLMSVLMIRYRLECTITLKRQNEKIEYMIYIRQRSIPLLKSIVFPYMHSSMMYKVL
jgi:LAGLIDADG DNA endonuclease family